MVHSKNVNSKNDLTNRNGDTLCQKFGCRKHEKLHKCFRGLFCAQHSRELFVLRQQLIFTKSSGNKNDECYMRQKEVEFRKTACPGHMKYLYDLENYLLNH